MSRDPLAVVIAVVIAVTGVVATGSAPASAAPTASAASGAGRGAGVSLPRLPGRYQVGTITRELVDHSRQDPFAPTPQPRSVLVQFWYPAARAGQCTPAPYMSPATAAFEEKAAGLAPGAIASIRTHACVGGSAARSHAGWPVLLFSPGSGTSRSLYTAMAEDMASQGFVVVAIDHPYDAEIVEFPDGRVVLRDQPPEGPTSNAVAVVVRADDVHFVLDQLPVFDTAPGGPLRDDLDLHRVGMFGHSMGGAAAAAAMLTDDRIAAGVNLDGSFYGPVVDAGLDRPFLLMSSAGHDIRTDPSWVSTWANLRGWRRDLELADSGHLTYSDIAVLYGPLHLNAVLPPAAVGTIDGVRAVDIEQTYLTAYFDHFLRHAPAPLLEHPDPRYPEVLFMG